MVLHRLNTLKMMFLKYALLFCCCCLALVGWTQPNYTFKPVATLPGTVDYIQVDRLQRLYIVQNDYELIQCDPTGTPLYTFNENTLGPITYIDVSNPFRLLVYYDDYATVVLLDRTLSELQRYDLSGLDLPQTQAIGMASDNHLWVFDLGTATLKKVDQSDQVLVESLELDLLLPEPLNPIRLLEYNNRVYLHDPQVGILVLDVFGTYVKIIPLPEEVTYFQWQDEKLLYTHQNILHAYEPATFLTQQVPLSILQENAEQVCVAQELLYIRYPDRVAIFRLRKK